MFTAKELGQEKEELISLMLEQPRSNDYFLTITESRKRFNDNGYDRHKIFLYKEDFNKFIKALTEAVDYVKTDLMPDFDFDAFNHDNYDENGVNISSDETPVEVEEVSTVEEPSIITTVPSTSTEEVDKW